jgi:hypothetical protein
MVAEKVRFRQGSDSMARGRELQRFYANKSLATTLALTLEKLGKWREKKRQTF